MIDVEISNISIFSCREFVFPTNKHLDGRELSCVALFPGVDTLAEDDAVGTAGKLTVEECEVSRINMDQVI